MTKGLEPIKTYLTRLIQGKIVPITVIFELFQNILQTNNRILELMADMNDKSGGDYIFDRQYILSASREMNELVDRLIRDFNLLAKNRYTDLGKVFLRISEEIETELSGKRISASPPYAMGMDAAGVALADSVGGKAANLGELKTRFGHNVPKGFVITTSAYRKVIEGNLIAGKIEKITGRWRKGSLTTSNAASEIQEMLENARIPEPVANEIRSALSQNNNSDVARWAVRSSAIGEDSETSFAGQFKTLLNVPSNKVLPAYLKIIASLYSESAMEYRQEKGLHENETAMAVACMEMIHAEKSGVLHTLDPAAPEDDTMVISAAWGLGAPIVSGKIRADRFRVSRNPPYPIVEMDIIRKPERLMPSSSGECAFEHVPVEMQTAACINYEAIHRLVETGSRVEKYFKAPQEIEWAYNADNNLYILQSRPLNIRAGLTRMVCDISDAIDGHPVIFANKGEIAQSGITSGKVFPVKTDEDLRAFPDGAILVARSASPRFAAVAAKANGIITDVGSATGHLANIAREFRIPTILNTGIATKVLSPGMEITMDAQENIVYSGIIKKLCFYEFIEESFEDSPEYRTLHRILKKIAPLSLTDPRGNNFTPAGCRTYHDITRFIHEKAVAALIHFEPGKSGEKKGGMVTRLESDIPIDLRIIDIKDGIVKAAGARKKITEEEIRSMPMRAFLAGLGSMGWWDTEPLPVDFKGFMSSLTRTFSPELASPRFVGLNLAVISREYANISLKLGYHFNLISAYIGENINDNYVSFHFQGGVTDQLRRDRRAKLIAMILEENDFMVEFTHDIVVANLKKFNTGQMLKKVKMLGNLVAFTRQLDVRMDSDGQIEKYLLKFNRLIRNPVSDSHAADENVTPKNNDGVQL
ncbi:MAG: pyruvate, water dikinase [Deltaproteobacteria bacterium]|nr:pyruvate, water dikinase [Deltaproteobacteria bacterium]